MANIDAELTTIAESIYGSEMRMAIHDAIEKVNNDITPPTIDKTTVEFGELGVSPFFGECTFETNGSVVIIKMQIQPNVYNPHIRPSGTVVDTGYTLFHIPAGFEPVQGSIKTHIYPYASDAYEGTVPYIDIDGEFIKLYYGWNDVMTDEYVDYYASGMYFLAT